MHDETVVYISNSKPYDRRVNVFGWRNGNRSSIPNTYNLLIPAYSTTSARVSTFSNEPTRYTSILVGINNVLKRTPSEWVIEDDYKGTCASIAVHNCYDEDLTCHLTNTCDDDDDDNGFPSF